LRDAVRSTTEMLDGVPLKRINPGGDTIQIGLPPDSVRRRIPPDTGRDNGTVPPTVPPSDSRPPSPTSAPWAPNREQPRG
jgi:hypothetical protein